MRYILVCTIPIHFLTEAHNEQVGFLSTQNFRFVIYPTPEVVFGSQLVKREKGQF